jgi:hypothetical protein
MTNIRLEQAKAIDIVSYLSKNGMTPTKDNGRRAFFKSPFRSENDASFVVDLCKNRWSDYGCKSGGMGYGDAVDLVSQYQGCTVSEAITILLDDQKLNKHILPEKIVEDTFSLIIEKDEPITSPYLIEYLESRMITPVTYNKFCREVTYHFDSRGWNHFLSVGFQNDLQGWELRDPIHKLCSKPKTVTTLRGKGLNIISVFEGFMDFLSLYSVEGDSLLDGDCIILNSVVFATFTYDYIVGYDEINLFLDNDNAGDDCVDGYMSLDANVIDRRGLYAGFKDINDWLINK